MNTSPRYTLPALAAAAILILTGCRPAPPTARSAPAAAPPAPPYIEELRPLPFGSTLTTPVSLRIRSTAGSSAAAALFIFPTAGALPADLVPAEGIIAALTPVAPASPAWVRKTLLNEALEALSLPPDFPRFIVVQNDADLSAASELASDFDGIILLPADYSLPPPANLANLPAAVLSNAVLPLVDTPQRRQCNTPILPLASAVNPPPPTEALGTACNLLLRLVPRRNCLSRTAVVWSGLPPVSAPLWGILPAARQNQSSPAEFTATVQTGTGGTQLAIRTRNLRSFSIETARLPLTQTARIRQFRVDDTVLTADDDNDGRLVFSRSSNGRWCASALAPEAPTPVNVNETIRHRLETPAIAVYGTLNPESAAAWQECANAFARQWQMQTGVSVEVIADRDCGAERLHRRTPILFGAPEENCLTALILREKTSVLRHLFAVLQAPLRNAPDLCTLLLAPAEEFSSGQRAILVLCDQPSAIPRCASALLSPRTADGNFIFYSADRQKTIIAGWQDTLWNH